jgi:hypothetical protein
MAASRSDDRTTHVWGPRAPSGGWATARAGGAVLCVEFDPSGAPHLAVGSADRRAVVYEMSEIDFLILYILELYCTCLSQKLIFYAYLINFYVSHTPSIMMRQCHGFMALSSPRP